MTSMGFLWKKVEHVSHPFSFLQTKMSPPSQQQGQGCRIQVHGFSQLALTQLLIEQQAAEPLCIYGNHLSAECCTKGNGKQTHKG